MAPNAASVTRPMANSTRRFASRDAVFVAMETIRLPWQGLLIRRIQFLITNLKRSRENAWSRPRWFFGLVSALPDARSQERESSARKSGGKIPASWKSGQWQSAAEDSNVPSNCHATAASHSRHRFLTGSKPAPGPNSVFAQIPVPDTLWPPVARRYWQGGSPERTMDPFRCIQADRLLLDHQLRGVPATFAGGLTPDVRKILQDATLLAFEHMIDQALAHDVHCLLISGDSFDPDDRGLRGPAALVRGIQRLAEHDIPVMLYANRPDLWSSWPAGLRLPANAHCLGAGLATSASVAREGKLLATITADESAPGPAGRSSAVRSDWSIHLP